MEVLRPHNEDGTEGIKSPVVEVPTALGKIALHWLNTRIRTFNGNEQFNHVEYYDDEGQLVGFQDQEVMDILHDHNFPTLDMPYVDTGTFNWLANGLSDSLESELQEFTGDDGGMPMDIEEDDTCLNCSLQKGTCAECAEKEDHEG